MNHMRLDVVIPTSAVLPAGFAGAKGAGKLDLALKIGPLAPITAVAPSGSTIESSFMIAATPAGMPSGVPDQNISLA